MSKNIDEIIEQIVRDVSEIKNAVETSILFTDEIFENLFCISEPDLEEYKNTFKTNRIKAYAVMDYTEKAMKLLKQTDEQTKIIFDYLIKKQGALNNE